ncbi:hypothetical protein [Rhizosaccharibacter radicis]|uniref:DUF1328 domain-containing protein n=1 Tax=Rhizosaccharibacter radicis TaxID=2782605 RepID=A0ABT1VXM9_9PROT|nr:hypothetical protein [Acetobacteraceae bacterium KSS12]
MPIAAVFCLFALIFGLGGYLLPHIIGGLGYDMVLIYLLLALSSALVVIIRR